MSNDGTRQATALEWRAMAVRSVMCLLFSLGGWALHGRWHEASTAAYMLAFLFGGWDLTRQVWVDLRHLQFDTHFLMMLVVPGSVAVGAWGEGALLLVLFSASSAMESYALGRTRREIDALLRRAPRTARRLVDGKEALVPVESLLPGDTVRVTANEQVPVDLVVTSGTSACDESSLTGESVPVDKGSGKTAAGGTLNLWGVLEGRVLRPASESALQRIIRLIESAQRQKAPVQRFTDRFGTGYTVAVLAACTAVFLHAWLRAGSPLFLSVGDQPSAFYRAMTLLVVLSPCALVLSVPSAILSAIAHGARHGILFRGGAAVENLARVGWVTLDKTGTLTVGELKVTGFELVKGDGPTLEGVARALATVSNHPMSRAVARHLGEGHAADGGRMEASETVPGRGLRATWNGMKVALGHRELVPASAGLEASELPGPREGLSEVWVAMPGGAARFLLMDTLRPEAPALIRRLHADGVETCILTGDRATTAAAIAAECGIREWRADLKPEDKLSVVMALRKEGRRVAMVGDGVNDAPVLAAADVGIAMGGRGSDAAIEQADIVLMNDRLENVVKARELSVRANKIIRQNLAVSLGTIGVMGVLAVLMPRLPLTAGVAAHEGSTVLVVLNSLRLLSRGGGASRGDGASVTP